MGFYKLTSQAEADLTEIWVFIALDDQAAADRFVEIIFEKIQLLAAHKALGRKQEDFIVDLRMFPVGRYQIYYSPTDDGVEIYRVIHGSRDVETEL